MPRPLMPTPKASRTTAGRGAKARTLARAHKGSIPTDPNISTRCLIISAVCVCCQQQQEAVQSRRGRRMDVRRDSGQFLPTVVWTLPNYGADPVVHCA
eukprot:5644667-Pleurochrysis_carterae.AAC.5